MTMGNEEREGSNRNGTDVQSGERMTGEEQDTYRNEMSETTGAYHDAWFGTMPHVFAVCGYSKGPEGSVLPLQPVLFRKEREAYDYMRDQVEGHDPHALIGGGGVHLKCFEIPVRNGAQPPEQVRCMICDRRVDEASAYIDCQMHRPVYNICEDCVPAVFRTLKDLRWYAEKLARKREE